MSHLPDGFISLIFFRFVFLNLRCTIYLIGTMRVKKGGKTYDRGKRLHQGKGRNCETPQRGNFHTKSSDSDAEDKWLKYREFPNDTGRDMFASSSSGSSSEMSAFDKLLADNPIHIPPL